MEDLDLFLKENWNLSCLKSIRSDKTRTWGKKETLLCIKKCHQRLLKSFRMAWSDLELWFQPVAAKTVIGSMLQDKNDARMQRTAQKRKDFKDVCLWIEFMDIFWHKLSLDMNSTDSVSCQLKGKTWFTFEWEPIRGLGLTILLSIHFISSHRCLSAIIAVVLLLWQFKIFKEDNFRM